MLILTRSNSGQAQPGTDTICLPVPVFKKIYSAALQKKYTDSLLVITEKQVSELQAAVGLLEEKDGELKRMYEAQIANLNNQISIFKDQVIGYEKLLKKERRRRFWTGALSVVTAGTLGYLYLTK